MLRWQESGQMETSDDEDSTEVRQYAPRGWNSFIQISSSALCPGSKREERKREIGRRVWRVISLQFPYPGIPVNKLVVYPELAASPQWAAASCAERRRMKQRKF